MLVKICGLTRPGDAAVAAAAGADLLGFVFVPGTPRAVDPDAAVWIRHLETPTVGVFRNTTLDEVLRVRDQLQLDWVQLHGDEPDAWLDRIGGRLIRRVPVAGGVDWQRVAALAEHCLPLIDPGAGDGITCDWRQLRERPQGIRLGLAGGLTPDNVAEAVAIVRPDLVDVSSGVERRPGSKDPNKVATFITAARSR